ncbi:MULTISPECIES: substrate-binding periplasmic protein [Gammaproteobacteria]|uniref:substrate-binding periplasmic protein n=1 Tax=Gammaproteobacteria TaxID=1236 RepID=UPI001914901E|nr:MULTISPECIES: transporter substrate-binding domain-containing protein [Gammaproteobacteria]MBK5303786.1 transporter substrate-binding domain-containing protein [Bacillus sp. TH86]MBK5323555.1 transporter substrate-binding domain-containing protein [Bacillus sp. TH59]MBK5338505.1 transporter substrate-binding domain-containing protein [Bacillus sp. TH57]MBK5312560.1 transporter substrate-binding domain-containing protein [Pseudomonas sp. TH71]MBK5318053.1 transporter substrate-binding domain
MARRGLLLMVFAVFCSLARAEDAPTPSVIHLASEAWEDYTAADGHGLGWDVLRKVFEPAGVKLDIRTEPYTRAMGLAQRGEVDACVGSYREEASDLLYPRWNFDTDHIYALGLASNPAPTLDTLGDYRLAWVRGYKYQAYLPNVQRYNEVVRRTGILPMLTHNRADYYVDALTEVDYVVSRAQDPSQFRRTHIAELPLFLCFADTPRARTLMALFDQRMEVLVKNGQLKPIFAKWKQPYPFGTD